MCVRIKTAMAVLKIAQLGHPILRQKAKWVSPEEIQSEAFQRLIEDMFTTLIDADGVGLAAPQVHEGKRLFVIRLHPERLEEAEGVALPELRQVFINPEIVERSSKVVTDWEGCLSFYQLRGLVPRPEKIKVKALNHRGEEFEIEASGLQARVIQHEYDHLEGILYLDQMEDLSSLTYLENWHRQREPEGED